MKNYQKAILKQIQRAEQLNRLNNIQAAREKAIRKDNSYSKEIYQHSIELSRRLRAEHKRDQSTWK